MDDEPERGALFYIEGPDEEGCVWISSTDAGGWHFNLGPTVKVAGVLSQWLASIYDAERNYRDTQDSKSCPEAFSEVIRSAHRAHLYALLHGP
jgi:hypothetical protein